MAKCIIFAIAQNQQDLITFLNIKVLNLLILVVKVYRMKINELKAGASNVTIKAKVAQKDEPREVVTKYGKRLSVANITLKDNTGTIAMSLWGGDINTVNVGDEIEVSNGYVNEFRGTPQLSTGKFGKIKVLEKSGNSDELSETEEVDKESSDDASDDVPEGESDEF